MEQVRTQENRQALRRAFSAAFPLTLPIMAGFLFLGLAYGMYMNVSGFSFLYPMLMSLTVFAGSMEFVAVGLLLAPFDPAGTIVLTLMINARHLFYGLSMLDRFRGTGWKKPYLIFGMCDESFSINCTADIPPDVDKGWFMLFVTVLNHLYWVLGSTLGGLFGQLLTFDTQGLSFVMTALFVVIFLEQWAQKEARPSALLGLGLSLLCLLVFGSGNFILPSMAAILAVLSLVRSPGEKARARA